MELPKASMERLKLLKDKTEATSYAEVTKNAYRLYERLIDLTESGHTFIVQDDKGNQREIEFFM